MTWKELLVSFCLSETHSPGMNEPIAIRLTPADALLALSAYDHQEDEIERVALAGAFA
jgi:hypothetical protein